MVSLRWAWAPEPASWLEGASFLKIPRWADASAPSPFYPWDWLPAHPNEAMMIIKRLKLTGAAGHPGFPRFNVIAGGPGSLAVPFGLGGSLMAERVEITVAGPAVAASIESLSAAGGGLR